MILAHINCLCLRYMLWKKFLIHKKGTYYDGQAVDLYDGFIKLLSNNTNFKQYKMPQLKESPKTFINGDVCLYFN